MSTNLDLARELCIQFLDNTRLVYLNDEIHRLIDGGFGAEYEWDPLPGETLDDIRVNLQRVIEIASTPVPMPIDGYARKHMQRHATIAREDFRLFACVALALLES